MSHIKFGKKIAHYRQVNNLTIKELAEMTGLSTANISMLERDMGNPSLSVLERMAELLGMTVSQLLEDEIDVSSLVLRKEDRQQIYNPDDKYIIYDVLTPRAMKAGIQMTLVHCEPRSETYNGEFHCHTAEEVVYMLKGCVRVVFENTEIEFREGDTLRIPARYLHRYINDSDEPAELLTVE